MPVTMSCESANSVFGLASSGQTMAQGEIETTCNLISDQKSYGQAVKKLVKKVGKEKAYQYVGLAALDAFKQEKAGLFTFLVRKLNAARQLDVLVDIESSTSVSEATKETATKAIAAIVDHLLNEFIRLDVQDKKHQNIRNPLIARSLGSDYQPDKIFELRSLNKAPKLRERVFAEAKKDRPSAPVVVKASHPSCLRGGEKGSYQTGVTLTFTSFPEKTAVAQAYTLTPIPGNETRGNVWPQHLFYDCSFSADFGVCSGVVWLDDKSETRNAFVKYHEEGARSYVEQYEFPTLGKSAQFKIFAPYHDGFCQKQ